MANKQVNTPPQHSIVIHEEFSEPDNISTMICPLCNSRIKLYQIHYDEKFLMCCNIECVYPFGVTDCHIYKIECNEDFTKTETRSNNGTITTSSLLSNSDWSVLDRMTTNDGRPVSPFNVQPSSLVEKSQDMDKLEEVKKSAETEETIKKNVQRIKELNKQLFSDVFDNISNGKCIAHIAKMQERSGIQLLKQNELHKVKKSTTKISTGDFKIDFDSTKIAIKIATKEVTQK